MEINRIYNEDCLEGLRKLEKPVFDLVIFSPPYNVGKNYGDYKDKLPLHKYFDMLSELAWHIRFKALKPGGHVFVNVGFTNKSPYTYYTVLHAFSNIFSLQNNIVWVKSIHVGDKTHGHFKPINSDRYITPTHEFIFHFTPTGETPIDRLSIGVPYTDKSNLKRFKHDKDLRCRGSVWYIPYDTIQSKTEKGDHPAIYPVELVTNCIKLTGKRKGLLLDPFIGSGSSAIGALEMGWNYVGYELNSAYVEYAEKRIKNFVR